MTKLNLSSTKATLNNGTTEEVWKQINDEGWKLISSPDSRSIGSKMNNNSFEKYVERFKQNLR
ncbi:MULTISPECIES: hypothetical protein [Paenibacillus]|uniref:DUF4177 domain-containing protein n=2 Tax=Paenibacillus TaxID=44249 RepID=A0ABX2ZCY7_PAEPO|nr:MULTISPECIES: hypothetical protein [Paenibacillus]MDR6779404.1 hypothetical protein [Paenibacillus peoriae]ODA08300.1 hypothetical protein A7312_27575 [Paenibacillus polymyxa]